MKLDATLKTLQEVDWELLSAKFAEQAEAAGHDNLITQEILYHLGRVCERMAQVYKELPIYNVCPACNKPKERTFTRLCSECADHMMKDLLKERPS